jgi:hypothetical protein
MSIESELKDLIEAFERTSTGLFEITGRFTTTFDQGIYACAIIKPSKRIRTALGVDRELLLVASNFRDQQQRTIRLLQREIENSNGRFETTIALVIHQDSDGNSKLKNWGRDFGISILPLFRETLSSRPADLERSLCSELYSHDPFDITGPVSDDSNFFGRRDEALDLARKLQRGQIRSCLGIRKIGKTSIINRIVGELRGTYDCITLMIDCSRDDVWSMSAAQLLFALAESTDKAAVSTNGYASISPATTDGDLRVARDRFEKVVLSLSKPLILVFDEIDYVTPGSPTNQRWRADFNSFWRNLRSVYQECARENHQISILVGGVSTYWFTVESIDSIENAALAFVPEEYLSPLAEGATVAMLKRLGKVAGLRFEDAVAELIARTTGNMPYWARKCSSYIHRQIPISERPCAINQPRAEPLIEAFVSEEGAAISEVALRHLFRVHPNLLGATRKCVSGRAGEVSENLRRILKRYGVLNASDALSGLMLTKGFASLAVDEPLPSGGADAASGPPPLEPTGLGDWAEELAALGKRRNVLERRLRELVLNFLRFDAMTSGKPGAIKEKVLAIIPESQRESLRHLSAEEAINKFLWSNLTQLICKEWSLFQKMFGDKDQFIRNCDLINDRYDAHAKPSDAADFALYRRALVHLEDRIAKFQ